MITHLRLLAPAILAPAILVALAIQPAAARDGQGRHHAAPGAYTGPGAEIFEATERAQNEPGLTSELDPSARQTATGGPSGGIPAFSGH